MRQYLVTKNQSVSTLLTSVAVLRQFLVATFIVVMLFTVLSSAQASLHQMQSAVRSGGNATIQFQHKSVNQDLKTLGWNTEQAKKNYLRASLMFEEGELIVAKRLLTPLALEGHREAQFLLGVVFDSFHVVDSAVDDLSWQSFIWYHAAARQGHSDAQHNLALAYARGEGVEVDLHKALQWWKRAAIQGNSDSQYNLGVMYAVGMHGVKRDLKQARMWWQRAANKGDAAAQYNLGALYATESAPFHNDCIALHWLMESRSNGFERADAALHDMDVKGISQTACK